MAVRGESGWLEGWHGMGTHRAQIAAQVVVEKIPVEVDQPSLLGHVVLRLSLGVRMGVWMGGWCVCTAARPACAGRCGCRAVR